MQRVFTALISSSTRLVSFSSCSCCPPQSHSNEHVTSTRSNSNALHNRSLHLSHSLPLHSPSHLKLRQPTAGFASSVQASGNDKFAAESSHVRPHQGRRTQEEEDYANLRDILQNNQAWVKEQTARDPTFFERLGRGQQPKYFYIGCADSRVPANEIMGLGPGEVFVHRNVGNMVVGTDANLLACLQFAVERLAVDHIIGELNEHTRASFLDSTCDNLFFLTSQHCNPSFQSLVLSLCQCVDITIVAV